MLSDDVPFRPSGQTPPPEQATAATVFGGTPHRENKMSDSADKKDDAAPEQVKLVEEQEAMPIDEQPDDRMEDEEKVLAGRHDVNYPAMLTKDVPGG